MHIPEKATQQALSWFEHDGRASNGKERDAIALAVVIVVSKLFAGLNLFFSACASFKHMFSTRHHLLCASGISCVKNCLHSRRPDTKLPVSRWSLDEQRRVYCGPSARGT